MTSEQDPRVFFAAERTYLAWLRTGLALMGFGFVVSRFGLFLREMQIGHGQNLPSTGVSLCLGVALVAMGVVVEIAATVRHVRMIEQLRSGVPFYGRISKTALSMAIFLTLIGIGLTVYLLLVR
ncbi:YidH family protein [Paracidobacterium acidisoli]|uniref:DUF202 domain-containing protein n=1 Tax=Paracidobacterium acidisoli TaxID=2303751 RepID=A0A372IU51_9BACT|nr:DUF202 domain-containing protein [Paracidobacterium acidisoli]MBT9329774.1 DUF202 domain-containing protein [Paracidobacterium acidisoli]